MNSDKGADGAPVIALVVAIAENGAIGRGGGLPWRLSSDMKRFKALTMGKPLVMGRKTFQSIGRALPGRDGNQLTESEAAKSGAEIGAGSGQHCVEGTIAAGRARG